MTTVALALAVPVALALGYLLGRASLAGQLDAARVALSRGVHLAERGHTTEARKLYRLPVTKSCLTCKLFGECERTPKPHPAPPCHRSLFERG